MHSLPIPLLPTLLCAFPLTANTDQLLKEAVEADEPSVGYDDMDEGAREIYEDLRERQAMVSCGMIDLERSFDDFRVVIGDGTL